MLSPFGSKENTVEDRPSRRFRASFPVSQSSFPVSSSAIPLSQRAIKTSQPGFRTGGWIAGVPGFGEDLPLLVPTTVEALRSAANERGVGIRLYADEERDGAVDVSYADLLERVKRAAGYLASRGVERGDRVLIVLPTSIEFIVTFFATQWLGGVPVPSYPPPALERLEIAIDRLVHIGSHSGAKVMVTTAQLRPMLGEIPRRVSTMARVVRSEALDGGAPIHVAADLDADDPCFIQYTSGSTGYPKGVLLTHRNVTSNVHAAGLALELRRTDRVASWLPLYHDMGLIGGLLLPIYWRYPLALMSPLAFLAKPLRWLKMIAENRSTMCAAPNFAYALAVRRTSKEERAALDLSSWRVALSGAEPVNARTVEDFCAAFAEAGFRREAMFPCYGLAEACLAVTFSKPGAPLRTISVDRAALADGYVVPREGVGSMVLVGCGTAIPAHLVLVVDEHGEPVPRGEVGHILVSGPSVMDGYFQDPAASAKVLQDGLLWTGDLGFQDGGALFITGRAKDLIIVRGKNYYAEDVEQCLERAPGVRPGGSVVFAVYDDERARDTVVAVCETKETDAAVREQLAEELTTLVNETCGLALEEVVLVEPGTIPKTSSGKKQRSLTRDRYIKDELEPQRTDTVGVATVFVKSAVGFLSLAGRKLKGTRRPQEETD
jgi:acyl-CoA synthetase (AMP-forming)/AMP-acid ligase II